MKQSKEVSKEVKMKPLTFTAIMCGTFATLGVIISALCFSDFIKAVNLATCKDTMPSPSAFAILAGITVALGLATVILSSLDSK